MFKNLGDAAKAKYGNFAAVEHVVVEPFQHVSLQPQSSLPAWRSQQQCIFQHARQAA